MERVVEVWDTAISEENNPKVELNKYLRLLRTTVDDPGGGGSSGKSPSEILFGRATKTRFPQRVRCAQTRGTLESKIPRRNKRNDDVTTRTHRAGSLEQVSLIDSACSQYIAKCHINIYPISTT